MKVCKNQILLNDKERATMAKMIKKRRKDLGISSGQKLAEKTGLNIGTINKLETNKNERGTSKYTINKLTEALECDLDYLIGNSEYPTKLDEQKDKINKKRNEMIEKLVSSHNKENLFIKLLLDLSIAESIDDRFVFEQSHLDSFANHGAFERYIYGRFSSNSLRVKQVDGNAVYIKKSDMDQIYSDLYHYLEMLISHYGTEAPEGILSLDAPEIDLSTEEKEKYQCMTSKQYWKQFNKSPEKYAAINRTIIKDKEH